MQGSIPANLVDPFGLDDAPPLEPPPKNPCPFINGEVVCTAPPHHLPGFGNPGPKGPGVPPPVGPGKPTQPKATNEAQRHTPNQCRLYALKRNGLGLGLDIAGIVAEGILSEISVPASVIAAGYVGAAAIGNAVAHGDWFGLAVAYGGRHAGVAEGFTTGRALSIAKGISILGLATSTLFDLQHAKDDYENCLAGREGP